MKKVIGIILIVVGVGVGLYAGIWWAFIGGIVDVVTQIRAPELSALSLAVGVAKILFAGVIGWVVGIVAVFPGYYLATT